MSEMTHFPMLHCAELPPFNTQQVKLVQNGSFHCYPVFRDRRRGSRSRKTGRLLNLFDLFSYNACVLECTSDFRCQTLLALMEITGVTLERNIQIQFT